MVLAWSERFERTERRDYYCVNALVALQKELDLFRRLRGLDNEFRV